MKTTIDQLFRAQAELEQIPGKRILELLHVVTRRWLDCSDPIRREAEAQLAESSGLTPRMLRRGLDGILSNLLSLPALLDQDLGTRDALDGYVERAPGVWSMAWGPRLLTCILSGNVPGLPCMPMALALALKSACLARPASGEPFFAELFARSVAEVDAMMGRCLAVARWDYDELEPLERAGAVWVYGSEDAIAAIRANVPADVRFIAHGHKITFAMVAREAANRETAHRLALDVAMFDQQGCVSPQMAYIERGGELSPAQFALVCGDMLASIEIEMPRGRLTHAEAVSLRGARDEAEFAADVLRGSHDNLAWTVAHYERAQPLPSPLWRFLRTFAVDDMCEVARIVVPFARYLQTAAFSGHESRRMEFAALLGGGGASRICAIGRSHQPGPLWRHDGRPSAGDLVRWTDIEA